MSNLPPSSDVTRHSRKVQDKLQYMKVGQMPEAEVNSIIDRILCDMWYVDEPTYFTLLDYRSS